MSKTNIVSDSDTAGAVTPEKITANEKPSGEKTAKFVYIGPSLPNAKLMENAVLIGTRKEISEYYKDVIERFPSVEKLIVPVERLSESRIKARTSGNVLNKYYNDLIVQAKKGAAK